MCGRPVKRAESDVTEASHLILDIPIWSTRAHGCTLRGSGLNYRAQPSNNKQGDKCEGTDLYLPLN